MSNLAPIQLIRPQRVDFDTTQITDWPDGLPVIGTPGLGGMRAGDANVGNGGISVGDIQPGAGYGAHVAAITAVAMGLTRFGVTAPDGIATASGVVGLPLFAAGVTLTLTQGATPFAVGDSFAIAVLPTPVDISGLIFDLDARMSVGGASIALRATSGGTNPTIANGGGAGTIAMMVPKTTMARLPVKLDGYPYAITATDPVTGLTVPAFYGLIHHAANAAQIGQGA